MALLRGISTDKIKKSSGLITSLIVLSSFVGQVFSLSVQASETDNADLTTTSMTEDSLSEENTVVVDDEEQSIQRLSTNYTTISSKYTASEYSGADVVYKMEDVLNSEYASLLTLDNYDYENGSVADVSHGDYIEVTVEVFEDALYEVGFDYLSYDESILPLEIAFTVDGNYPFYESRSITLETTWVSDEETDIDRYGNEIVSLPSKLIQWEHKELGDSSYRYSTPLLVELTKGTHTFGITVKEGTMLLGNLTLSAPTRISEYSGSEEAKGDALIVIEGEDFTYRNDSSIHASFEYDNSLSPLSAKQKVLNVVDEDSFNTAGQRITYSFNVTKAGYYNLAMNYRQSEKNDFPVFLDIRIDGEIPNTEFMSYWLTKSTKFTTKAFTDSEGNVLSVYLEEGEHTISMTISADNIRYALEDVDRIMSEISDLSLEVTKVAGTNKDKYRDLKLTRYIPDLEERLQGWVDDLYSIAEQAQGYVGADDPKDVAAFSYLLIAADQLQTLADEPDELVYRVDELSTSVNSINTQIANFVDIMNDNDVSIDRIYLFQEDAKLPSGLNFFEGLMMSAKRFFYSFFLNL